MTAPNYVPHIGTRAGVLDWRYGGSIAEIVMAIGATDAEVDEVSWALAERYGLRQKPRDIPVLEGLVCAYDARYGITLNGGNVSAWADRSLWRNDLAQATAGAQPQYIAADADFGGLPSIQGATGDFISRVTFTGGSVASPYTRYAVVRTPSSLDNGQICGSASGSSFGGYNPNRWQHYSGAGPILTPASPPAVVLTRHIVRAETNGAAGSLRATPSGAAEQSATGNAGTSSHNGFTALASDSGGALPWLGKLSAAYLYSRILTASEDAAMMSYLRAVWGIS